MILNNFRGFSFDEARDDDFQPNVFTYNREEEMIISDLPPNYAQVEDLPPSYDFYKLSIQESWLSLLNFEINKFLMKENFIAFMEWKFLLE